jgi:hypothetical protein
MSASSKVTFGTETVNGPEDPGDISAYPMFVSDLAANYSRWTYQTTSTKKWLWTLKLRDLTASQKAALETYFQDTAKGPTNTFTYVHTDGASYANARFADTELQFQRHNPNIWDCQVRIEVENQPT